MEEEEEEEAVINCDSTTREEEAVFTHENRGDPLNTQRSTC